MAYQPTPAEAWCARVIGLIPKGASYQDACRIAAREMIRFPNPQHVTKEWIVTYHYDPRLVR